MSLGKKNIVNNISTKAFLSKSDSALFLQKFLHLLKNSNGKTVKIPRFGSFVHQKSPKRIGRNPKTKEEFIIDTRLKLVFKTSKFIKEKFN